MQRQVGQIAHELGGAVEQTAASAGQLDNFRNAMSEYASAKKWSGRLDTVKDIAKQEAVKGTIRAVGMERERTRPTNF